MNQAPLFKTTARDNESPLRKYIAAQDDILTILGPRRVPALPCPAHSTNSAIPICTSVGFSQLGADEYHDAVHNLRPDVAITMADVITSGTASLKRVEKSADRTHAWMRDAHAGFLSRRHPQSPTAVFAAIPPVDNVQQSLYLQDLAEEYHMLLSGLAIYSSRTALELPEGLADLPRICLSDSPSPHAVLNDIALGADLVTMSFITASSNHGIALTFDFTALSLESEALRPLGYDVWKSGLETSLEPLSPGCDCFTCTHHHKAYVHHLLQAKEMLAWTLLQLHNHAIMDRFFATARKSIAQGTFEEDVRAFNQNYEPELPANTGTGPRTRGYQTKSIGGGEAKKNEKSWGRLDGAAHKLAEGDLAIASAEGDPKQVGDHEFKDKV